MKATIEFDLDDADDRREHKDCVNAFAFKAAIREYDNALRAIVKYEDDKYSALFVEGIQAARDMLHEHLDDLKLWD